jgi:hypothetical protein
LIERIVFRHPNCLYLGQTKRERGTHYLEGRSHFTTALAFPEQGYLTNCLEIPATLALLRE